MKHICSIYFFLIFSLITHNAWGQTPDSIPVVDSTAYRSVVTDRINEIDERERGPSISKIMKKADESFGKKNYYAAMKYYSYVLKPEPLNVEALKGYGESAFAISALDSAESAFQRMVDRGLSTGTNYFPKMRLAEVKYRKGNYLEALDLFSEIALNPQTPNPVTPVVKEEAKARKRDCEWALSNLSLDIVKEGSYTILDTTNVNTLDFAEYAAFQDGDQLFFSAYRFDLKKDRANPKRHNIKLLSATSTNNQMGAAQIMTVSESNDINDLKRQHTAHFTLNESGNTVYYAVGDYLKDSADIRFDLYRRKKKSDGGWGDPEKLGLNAAGYTNTEPTIGTLPGQKNETLFFVSDRLGGEGKRDIWYSRIVGDSLSAPLPLADLNTKGDDVTPFYHARSNNLYFSTDGTDTLLRTIGGYDIYRAKYVGGKWGKPRHLGTPINSPANDVFFILDDESQKAYFSNNLRGNSNDSEEGCCYDIYAVEFERPKLRAIGFHKLTKEVLPYTRITLYESGLNGQLVPVANPQPDTTSSYAFDVALDKDYVLIANKKDFSSDTLRFRTPDEVWSGEIVKKLYLRPFINLIATVYDCETNLPIYGATAKFFDLGFRDTTGNFIANNTGGRTDILAATTNRQDYKIDFEHQYFVTMEKKDYIKPDTSIVVSTVGRVTGGTIEVKLYLQRPDPLNEYLPIPLYFDNDFPNPRTISDTTFLDYQKTFVDYMKKKEPEFIPGYIRGLKGAERTTDSLLIDNFFELEVRSNWVKFFEFSDSLYAILERGDSIELTLKGYASPLANSEYNLHLTNRRIASVYNHFQIFDGGVFKRYYKTDNSGSLKIIREPNGDSKAPVGISDNGRDRRSSVYDVAPSRERRVEIVGVRVRKENKGNCD